MRIQNSFYSITAAVETMPVLDAFDVVHNLNNKKLDDFYMAWVFNVLSSDGSSRSIALIDLLCGGYEPYAVLEDHALTALLFDGIVRIDLTTGLVVQHEKCKNLGGLQEIFPIENGYIIWGEGDIFRYDHDLNQIWHFMGRDILVSQAADKHFWIENDLIHCRDFQGWQYILDFDGNLLHNFREFEDPENSPSISD